jgi:hypothetical protein
LQYALRVQPAEAAMHGYTDAAGNSVARFLFPQLVSELRFDVDLMADLRRYNPLRFHCSIRGLRSFHFATRTSWLPNWRARWAGTRGCVAQRLDRACERRILSTGSINSVTLIVELNLACGAKWPTSFGKSPACNRRRRRSRWVPARAATALGC